MRSRLAVLRNKSKVANPSHALVNAGRNQGERRRNQSNSRGKKKSNRLFSLDRILIMTC